jgi:replicative DNA helicase
MFIYRPDEWEDDEGKKNLVKLRVAKHRNGPTGEINLIFLNKLAKFESAASWDQT